MLNYSLLLHATTYCSNCTLTLHAASVCRLQERADYSAHAAARQVQSPISLCAFPGADMPDRTFVSAWSADQLQPSAYALSLAVDRPLHLHPSSISTKNRLRSLRSQLCLRIEHAWCCVDTVVCAGFCWWFACLCACVWPRMWKAKCVCVCNVCTGTRTRVLSDGVCVCVCVAEQQQCYDPWSQVSSAPTLLRAYQTGAQIGHGDASVGCSVHIASVNRCADTACMRASGESVEVWMSTRHAAQQHIVRHRPHPVSISHHPLPRASPDVCVKRPTAQQDMQVACNAVAQCHEAFKSMAGMASPALNRTSHNH